MEGVNLHLSNDDLDAIIRAHNAVPGRLTYGDYRLHKVCKGSGWKCGENGKCKRCGGTFSAAPFYAHGDSTPFEHRLPEHWA